MAKWVKIAEVKENGFYIGWSREHPQIHESRKPPYIYRKHSLVQIGGQPGMYEVLGQTVMHPIFAKPGERGEVIYEKRGFASTLTEAKKAFAILKMDIAKRFDKLTRD